jgi:co-chaperonin GroES (HSP10)
MKPTTNRLLVKVEEKKKPEKGKELEAATSVMTGEVLKKGPEVKAIKVKDRVIFAPYGIDEVTLNDKKLLIISEELIIAVHE